MGIAVGALAVRALRWLGRAYKFWRSKNVEFDVAIKALRVAGIGNRLLEKIAKRLHKVEETEGAHTSAWSKIDRAKKQKRGLTLTAAEVKYLFAFKKVFDLLKKRFTR